MQQKYQSIFMPKQNKLDIKPPQLQIKTKIS
jgi:hypothetical protein